MEPDEKLSMYTGEFYQFRSTVHNLWENAKHYNIREKFEHVADAGKDIIAKPLTSTDYSHMHM